MRAGLRFYQVQAQILGDQGEWSSSRQVRTMIVGAVDSMAAGQEVSHVAWDASSGGYTNRRTIATVVEVINGDNGDIIPTGPMTWVMVDYFASGSIATVCAATYQQLTELSQYKR